MKKAAWFLTLLLSVILLFGCVDAPPPATTAPPRPTDPADATVSAPPIFCPDETTAPPETTTPTVTTEPVGDFSQYQAMLDFGAQPNWLTRAIGCVFEKPQDVNLYFMFYLGVDHPGSWDDLSPESRQTLTDKGFIPEMDLQIMPVEKLEEALRSTFGVSLKDVQIPEKWGYIKEENAWCSNHSDAFIPGLPEITAVEDDGETIVIHYTIDGYYNTATEEFLDKANLVLTLIRNKDGAVRAVSNVIE